MSMLPRRTNELIDGSNMKQERLSRIAQPTRGSSRGGSLRRTSSMDYLANNLLNPYITSSSVKTKRSVSATPSRTPNRSERLPPTFQLTSEKKRYPDDKKLIHEKAIKIVEYVEKYIFTSKDAIFSHTNGLKTMSTKQFITIINYLLKFIFGNRLSISANYVDQLPKILVKIDYPYTVNKSWLKTPTAPHAYNNIVTLIDWLMFFAPNQQEHNDGSYDGSEFEDEYIIPGGEFSDKVYTLMFLKKEKEGFILWNNKEDDESEKLKKDLINDLIFRKTQLSGLSAIEKKINKIKSEIHELRRAEIVIKHEKTFYRKDKEFRKKQQLLIELENEYEEKSKQLEMLKKQNENKLEIVRKIKKRISDYENVVRTQEMSVQKRYDLIAEINYLKQQLSAHEDSALQLRHLEHNKMVIFGRLLKKIVESVAKFNSFIDKIFSSVENIEEIHIKDMILDQNSDESIEDQLNRIIPIVKKLKEKNLKETAHYQEEMKNYEKQLKYLIHVYNEIFQEKYVKLNEEYVKFELKLEQMNTRNIERFVQVEKQIESITCDLRMIMKENDVVNTIIEKEKIQLNRYKTENETILQDISIKMEEILTVKETYIKQLKENVDQFAKTMEEIEKSFIN